MSELLTDPIQSTEAWAAFEDMRKAKGKRAPFTPFAKTRILFELRRFQADGHDIEEILWTSVTNGWSGVFAVKRKGWTAPTQSQVPSKAVDMSQQWIRDHGPAREADRSDAIAKRLAEARARIVGVKA